MANIADAYKDDLEVIRKEPELGANKLNMLIDSLASGADIYSSIAPKPGQISDMEVALGEDLHMKS